MLDDLSLHHVVILKGSSGKLATDLSEEATLKNKGFSLRFYKVANSNRLSISARISFQDDNKRG
jgi:hypothetical protein